MQSKHAVPAPRRDALRRLFAVSLLAMQLVPPAHAGVQNTGRWTASPHWVWGRDVPYGNGTTWQTRTPVHLTLMPGGSSGYHSRILFYDGDGFTLPMAGGMWGWNPGQNDACVDTARLGFTELPLFDPPNHNIFCSSHTLLPPGSSSGSATSPKVFITGGTEQGEVGLTSTVIFDPAGATQSAMWTAGPDLSARRWYPTTTITPLQPPTLWTFSGAKYALLSTYGGRDPAAASDAAPSSALRRLGLNIEGTWESDKTDKSPIAPPWAVWPRALMHHAFATTDLWYPEEERWQRQPGVPVMFGGEYPSGGGLAINNKTYLMFDGSVPTGTDEDYYFQDLSESFTPPQFLARAEAVMFSDGVTVVDDVQPITGSFVGVVVWGGRDQSGPSDRTRLWHMRWDPEDDRYEWNWYTIATDEDATAPPTNRYGHAAFYDPEWKRILIWGGTSNGTDPVSDAAVYALDIADPTAPKWKPVTVSGTPPSQRFGHRMIFDNLARTRTGDSNPHYRGILFGGKTASGYSNEAYSLWIGAGGSLEWKAIPYTGAQSPPDGRSYHVMMRDEFTDRVMIFGGQRASGTGDLRAWAMELPGYIYEAADNPGTGQGQWSPTWNQLDSDATLGVQGGAATMGKIATVARTPDLYTFGSGGPTRQTYAASSLVQDLYPFNFVLPNGKLLTTGPGYDSFTLDGPGSTWQKFPDATHSQMNLYAASSVMYLPGKVMMSGSKYPVTTVQINGQDENVVSNDSRSIDATAATPRWLPSVNTMFHRRVDHNLVVLPTGHVAAIGGTQRNRANGLAIRQPEFWNPNVTGTNQRGQWYQSVNGELLASHQLARGYHSVALLMPDGRILSCGGNEDGEDQNRAEIFCPPYLFKPDGNLAPRPSMTTHPTTIRPGVTFTICMDNPADVTRACLVTPGAPTHGFDQNQRYIPLAIAPATSGSPRLFVTAPADSNIAPPGWYLLFLTGSRDAAGTYPDAPSVGQWVRVERPDYVDPCDAVAPGTITNLVVDVTAPTAVFLTGTAPGDDGALPESGPPSGVEVRRNTVPVTSSNWAGSTVTTATAAFDPAGGAAYLDVTGLSPGTTYQIAHKLRDDAPGPNWSGISGSFQITTSGGGGGGGGYSLQPFGGANTSSMLPTEGGLIAETQPAVGGGWTVTLSRVSRVAGFTSSDAGSMVFQEGSVAAGWQTRRRMPIPGDVLGLCALKPGRRTLLLGDYGLQRAATRLDGANGALALQSAQHSRLGALSYSVADPLVVSLDVGDELSLDYAPDASAAGAGSEFASVGLAGVAAGFSRQPGRSPVLDLPERTVLHQSVPNPSSSHATIGFDLPRPSPVRIEVFDVRGRRVRTLTDRQWPAGRHSVTWDRLTDGGERAAAGVFLYRMTAEGFRAERKMVVGAK